eukprot:scaffold57297_cov76-Phaeocystis_antarctica.AAC.2
MRPEIAASLRLALAVATRSVHGSCSTEFTLQPILHSSYSNMQKPISSDNICSCYDGEAIKRLALGYRVVSLQHRIAIGRTPHRQRADPYQGKPRRPCTLPGGHTCS